MTNVHIVAAAARTPLGLTAASSAAALRAGIVRIRVHDEFMDPTGEPLRGAYDGRLPITATIVDRMAELAKASCEQLFEELPRFDPKRVPVLLALPESRPGFTAEHERALVARITASGLNGARPRVVGRGHAGSIEALRVGAEMIRAGTAELVIVVGTDSYFDPDTLHWLGEHRQLATRATRSSFFPGEAGACLALASAGNRHASRSGSVAILRGVGVAHEPGAHEAGGAEPTEVNVGRGLGRAIADATEGLAPAELVDRVLCDLNGERMRSEEWGFAALQTHARLRAAGDFEAPAGHWGDVGAASGVLFAAMAVHDWMRSSDPAQFTMVFAGSQTGARGAAVLQRMASEGASWRA